ncbi:MAG: chloride channel protein [candidate division Zixibacteria bacterium]|nr:chloride channel protein [candidate division Zixibacteria bacterium]
MRHKIVKTFFEKLQLSETNSLIILSIFVGLATGFGALGFTELILYFNHIFFGLTDQVLTSAVGRAAPDGYKYYLPLIPMIGGLLVGPIVFKFAREAKGHGVPEVMNAVARLGGIIRPRVAAAKAVASAICIGSGGSAGREGPIIQIGSAIGSTIGQMFRMSGDRVKILVGCGSAAGISAVFNAPLAGVLFAMEIILGDYAIRTFAPVLLSSVVASVVTRAFLGNNPAFQVPSYSLVSAWEIPLYIVMGFVIGVAAVLFTRTLDVFEDNFDKLSMPNWAKPALGGLLLGIIAIFFPQVLADGYQTIGLTLLGDISLLLMVVLVFLKILATSLTLGSGNSGGIFAPSLFMGAVAGGSFGVVINYFFPEVTATPGAYALVGMAAMVAGTTHAPITAIFIIYEMTLDYRIILPLMVTVVFSTLVARHLFPHSIYTAKLFKRGIDIRGGKDINVLRSHEVSEVMSGKFESILTNTTLAEIFNRITHSKETYFIVNDLSGRLKGVISFQDIRNLLSQHELDYLVIAQDLVEPETVVLNDDDTLETAYSIFGQRDFGLIPVVRRREPDRVIGVIRREKLVDYYNKRLIETLRY